MKPSSKVTYAIISQVPTVLAEGGVTLLPSPDISVDDLGSLNVCGYQTLFVFVIIMIHPPPK